MLLLSLIKERKKKKEVRRAIKTKAERYLCPKTCGFFLQSHPFSANSRFEFHAQVKSTDIMKRPKRKIARPNNCASFFGCSSEMATDRMMDSNANVLKSEFLANVEKVLTLNRTLSCFYSSLFYFPLLLN